MSKDPKEKPQQIILKHKNKFWHHCFKLKNAEMLVNTSFTDDPQYDKVTHSHFFHTKDSDGKIQVKSNAVGGHFHEVEVTETAGGVPRIKISGPKKEVRTKIRGRWTKIYEPIQDDMHMHEIEYLYSEELTPRQHSTESLKVQNYVANKEAQASAIEMND
jgi:hypothetical protein